MIMINIMTPEKFMSGISSAEAHNIQQILIHPIIE